MPEITRDSVTISFSDEGSGPAVVLRLQKTGERTAV